MRERIAQIVADDPEHVPLELLRLTLGGDSRTRMPSPRISPPKRTGYQLSTQWRNRPGAAGVSPESSTSSWGWDCRGSRKLPPPYRAAGPATARAAYADVRLRRDAVHLGEHRVHAREAQVAIDKPDPERRVVEDRVEDCARPLLAGASGPLGVEQAGAIERLRALLRDGGRRFRGRREGARRVEAERDRAEHALADLGGSAASAPMRSREGAKWCSSGKLAASCSPVSSHSGSPRRTTAATDGRVDRQRSEAVARHRFPRGSGEVPPGGGVEHEHGAGRAPSAPIASVTSTAATSSAVLARESAAVTAWSRATRPPAAAASLGALGVEELGALERLRALIGDREEERAFVGLEGVRLENTIERDAEHVPVPDERNRHARSYPVLARHRGGVREPRLDLLRGAEPDRFSAANRVGGWELFADEDLAGALPDCTASPATARTSPCRSRKVLPLAPAATRTRSTTTERSRASFALESGRDLLQQGEAPRALLRAIAGARPPAGARARRSRRSRARRRPRCVRPRSRRQERAQPARGVPSGSPADSGTFACGRPLSITAWRTSLARAARRVAGPPGGEQIAGARPRAPPRRAPSSRRARRSRARTRASASSTAIPTGPLQSASTSAAVVSRASPRARSAAVTAWPGR